MSKNTCEIFTSEYRQQYKEKKQNRTRISYPSDCFAERIEEDWQIDPTKASLHPEINENSQELAKRLIIDHLQTVYRVSYKNPKTRSIEDDYAFLAPSEKDAVKTEVEADKEFGSELHAYLRRLYFNLHTEKIFAPSVTAKRVFGYMRPRLLHGDLSTYQDTYGRSGGHVILRNAELMATAKRRQALKEKLARNSNKKSDSCISVKNTSEQA